MLVAISEVVLDEYMREPLTVEPCHEGQNHPSTSRDKHRHNRKEETPLEDCPLGGMPWTESFALFKGGSTRKGGTKSRNRNIIDAFWDHFEIFQGRGLRPFVSELGCSPNRRDQPKASSIDGRSPWVLGSLKGSTGVRCGWRGPGAMGVF